MSTKDGARQQLQQLLDNLDRKVVAKKEELRQVTKDRNDVAAALAKLDGRSRRAKVTPQADPPPDSSSSTL